MAEENKKERVWSPKCRASTFKDKRTKRNRTRSDMNKNSIKDSKDGN